MSGFPTHKKTDIATDKGTSIIVGFPFIGALYIARTV